MTNDRPTARTADETDSDTDRITLIQYVEVWVPSADEQHLNLVSACRLGKRTLLITPKSTTVAKGEGVAGRAWNQKSASIIQESPSELINHYQQLSGEQLVALVAIPIFHQTEMNGVVVLGLGPGFGAAELWSRDDRDELSVSMSFYSGLTSLEFIHQYIRFPKGGGFPGRIWKSGLPEIAGDLDSDADVVSTFDQDAANITAAIGVPIGSSGGFAACVLMLLSAQQSPIAGRIELWDCVSDSTVENDESEQAVSIRLNQLQSLALIGKDTEQQQDYSSDWRQAVCDRIARQPTPQLIHTSDTLLPAGTEFALVLPVFRGRELVGILNLMF